MAYDSLSTKSVTDYYDGETTVLYLQTTDALTSNLGVKNKKYTFQYQYDDGPKAID